MKGEDMTESESGQGAMRDLFPEAFREAQGGDPHKSIGGILLSEGVATAENIIENQPWNRLIKNAHEIEDPVLRAPLIAEMQKRMTEAQEKNMIDMELTSNTVSDILMKSNWDDFYVNLVAYGKSLERQSEATKGYKDPRYDGMIESLYIQIANEISGQSVKNIKETEGDAEASWNNDQWQAIGQKLMPGVKLSVDEIKNIYERRKRYADQDFASLLNLDIDHLQQLINQPPPKTVAELPGAHELSEEERRAYVARQPESLLRSQLIGKRVGAVINHGTAEMMARDASAKEGHTVPVFDLDMDHLDITESNLNEWADENVRVFSGDMGDNPAKGWFAHLNFYLETDLDTAFKMYSLNALHDKTGEERAEIETKLRDLKKVIEKASQRLIAKMAVSSTVRCMEASFGNGTVFSILTVGDDGRGEANLDNTDALDPYLLQTNAKYFEMVLNDSGDPKIAEYRDLLLREMGLKKGTYKTDEGEYEINGDFQDITFKTSKTQVFEMKNGRRVPKKDEDGNDVFEEARVIGKRSKVNWVDVDAYMNQELYKHLRKGGGGINSWINAILDREEAEARKEDAKAKEHNPGDEGKRQENLILKRDKRWLAIKTAADLTFANGDFTKWTAQLEKQNENGRVDAKLGRNHEITDIYASKDWAANTLNAVWRPTTLPHNVKNVFPGELGDMLMKYLDKTFRPDDIVDEDDLIAVSMVGNNFNSLARYYRMLGKAFGGSRAPALGDWGRDGQQSIRDVLELLDTISNRKSFNLTGPLGRKIDGREYEAIVMARFMNLKSEILIRNSAEPTWSERLFPNDKKDDMRTRFNAEALQFLLGPDLSGRSGFIAEMHGPKYQLVFPAGSEELLDQIIQKLDTNDQNASWRSISTWLSYVGMSLAMAGAIAGYALEVSGVGEFVGVGGGKKKR